MNLSTFEINGIDISTFNETVDWSKINCNFVAMRVGYGRTIDNKFSINWANSKGKVNRFTYWYMDYYSNWYNKKSSAYGLTDAAWGKEQADNCWGAIKNDPEGLVFLDVENGGSSYSKPLTDPATKEHAEIIARSFLTRMDELNKKKNGIYCSIGWISWFYSWFRDRPLWVAWYNKLVDKDDVLYSSFKNGWLGEVLYWQFSSTEKIAGIVGNVDGNGWIQSVERYASFMEKPIPPVLSDKEKLDRLWQAHPELH